MRGIQLRFPLGVVLCVLFVGQTSAAAPRLTLSEIISGMKGFERRFLEQPSWRVDYTQEREYFNSPKPAVSPYPRGDYINARMGQLLYSKRDFHADPRETSWCVWKDDMCTYLDGRVLELRAELHPHALQDFHYTDSLFIDTYRGYEFVSEHLKELWGADSPSAAFWMGLPRSIVAHKQDFKVQPQLVSIDGDPCYVLERPGKDIIFVDAAHGFVCRRRIYYQAPGVLLFEKNNSRLGERAPGLWLPQRQVVKRYHASDSPKALRGKLRLIETNTVKRLELGTLNASFFSVPIPEHAVVVDRIRGLHYTKYPKNAQEREILDDSISLARNDPSDERRHRRWVPWILVNAIVLSLLLLAYQVRKRRRS